MEKKPLFSVDSFVLKDDYSHEDDGIVPKSKAIGAELFKVDLSIVGNLEGLFKVDRDELFSVDGHEL